MPRVLPNELLPAPPRAPNSPPSAPAPGIDAISGMPGIVMVATSIHSCATGGLTTCCDLVCAIAPLELTAAIAIAIVPPPARSWNPPDPVRTDRILTAVQPRTIDGMNTIDGNAPYAGLSPDVVLNAIDSTGLSTDGRQLALNSYENRVYQVGSGRRTLRRRQVLSPGPLVRRANPRRARIHRRAGRA